MSGLNVFGSISQPNWAQLGQSASRFLNSAMDWISITSATFGSFTSSSSPQLIPSSLSLSRVGISGVQGNQLPQEEALNEEEHEVHGINWASLQDVNLLAFQRINNPIGEGTTL
ncbi:hypothetical protein B0H14DRAFT_2564664 [Mycena olivaceomarginata]|nr:hypothetical protein B0H14DRAFT_2564664 [Mycena olivaceomarginata]